MTTFGELRSIGHNIAASLASGVGAPIGYVSTDVFDEALHSKTGRIEVDFLRGMVSGARPFSFRLKHVVKLYRGAFAALCRRHGVSPATFRTLRAVYGVDAVHGPHFSVTLETLAGRRSVDPYVGAFGRRILKRGRR